MNFNDINYERIDYNRVKDIYEKALTDIRSSKNFDEVKSTIESLNKTRVHLQTMKEVASIKYSINTKDDYFVGENQYWDEYGPLYQDLDYELYQTLLSIGFKDQMIEEYGRQFYSLMECQVKSFSKDIIDLLQEENRLMSDYTGLLASAKIDFAGRVCNLSDMNFYMESLDDRVREEAIRAHTGFFEENEDRFDQLFDSLVNIRHQMALKMGYKSFIDLGYYRMQRTDYNRDMVANLRENVLAKYSKKVHALYEAQAQRIGRDKIDYFCERIEFLDGNAEPKGDSKEIFEAGRAMYSSLSKETQEFFDFLFSKGLFDVEARENKAMGGYCTVLPEYKMPFIFANFNGTVDDIDVLTHEAGHAFQMYMSRHIDMPELIFPTLDSCEIHSMSMEFFTYPWMDLFFGQDVEKYKTYHYGSAIKFLPYGCLVDHFQHEIYENPDMSPDQRKATWLRLENKYLPYRDYGDLDILNRGGYWFRQGHIYKDPFYYIDYVLAQICALNFYEKMQDDYDIAWNDYLKICRLGGRYSFFDLVKIANLPNPFN
ncbi:M3 family oligoendopeptidase [Peptostreptococcus stomatis]|uniref:M3 family oligoendopeptidase n=1 Tax=Peptostreptococcus stomatis TaxID=341694 RepID=UPI0028D53777|nr:M3 family oligoendopeptidase [Peptostreptococcus stomatis]